MNHKVHIYAEYHSVCPLVSIGTLPPPLPPASVPLPPEEWGGTLACVLGVGGVPIPTTGEKLSTLPTLWYEPVGIWNFICIKNEMNVRGVLCIDGHFRYFDTVRTKNHLRNIGSLLFMAPAAVPDLPTTE
jgi:hypothetical protein